MQFVSGHLYFIKDSFFEYVDDPNLMINYQNSSRPHYYAVRDRKTNLYWMIPCSTRVEKYEQILEKRKRYGRPTDTIKIVKIWGRKSVLLLQNMFPVSEKYVACPYVRKGKTVSLNHEATITEIEIMANRVIEMIRAGVRFISTQPDAMRIERLMLKEEKMMEYRAKAINCVRDTVLPIQRQQFEECGGSLDAQYEKYGDTDAFFATVIEPGHIYEVGYPKCVCPEVLSGEITDAAHCECSRQSVLYVLENLLPEKRINVEIIETMLGGGEKCRFRVAVD